MRPIPNNQGDPRSFASASLEGNRLSNQTFPAGSDSACCVKLENSCPSQVSAATQNPFTAHATCTWASTGVWLRGPLCQVNLWGVSTVSLTPQSYDVCLFTWPQCMRYVSSKHFKRSKHSSHYKQAKTNPCL